MSTLAREWTESAPDIISNGDEIKSKLPPIEDVADFVAREIPEPKQIINGVLHQGCKMAIGGSSKSQKSWSLIDLGLSVSHGEPWLSVKTTRAKVLYVNLELTEYVSWKRIQDVARSKNITIQPGWLHVWNLRGKSRFHAAFIPQLIADLKGKEFAMIILDPSYKLNGDKDENHTGAIASLLNAFEDLAQETGAAIVFASHFSKGNQANKESMDRISGSGVWARDPDAILTFTKHEVDDAFTVDFTLRNFKPIESFVVQWHWPLMRHAEELDPSQLKKPKGRGPAYAPDLLLEYLPKKAATTSAWQQALYEETGMSRTKFFELKKQVDFKLERNTKGEWKLKKQPSPESPESPN